MSRYDEYVPGAWNAICDRCGSKYKSYMLRKTWDNLMCCHGAGTRGCWEPRQPQDYVRGVKDNMGTTWARPPGEDVFVGVCTLAGTQAIPGLAIPGCAIPGRNNNLTIDQISFCTITGGWSVADFAEADCWTVGVFV
jgi:hypothetical protein